MIDYAINDQFLRVEHDIYEVSHIKAIYVIKHNWLQQFLRQLLLGSQFALIAGLLSLWLGPPAIVIALSLFAVGVIYGITTCEQIELRAKFAANDEAGDQVVRIMRANDDDQLEAILNIYASVQEKLARKREKTR
jgi:hypothetical protein